MGWMYAGLCGRDRQQAGAAPIMRPCADCPIVSSACFCPFFPAAPPAIEAHRAVGPLPRGALLLLCSAYVVPGFVGGEPWKSADITAFGYMLALARGQTP